MLTIFAFWYFLCGLGLIVVGLARAGWPGWHWRLLYVLPGVGLSWPYWMYHEVRFALSRRRMRRVQ